MQFANPNCWMALYDLHQHRDLIEASSFEFYISFYTSFRFGVFFWGGGGCGFVCLWNMGFDCDSFAGCGLVIGICKGREAKVA